METMTLLKDIRTFFHDVLDDTAQMERSYEHQPAQCAVNLLDYFIDGVIPDMRKYLTKVEEQIDMLEKGGTDIVQRLYDFFIAHKDKIYSFNEVFSALPPVYNATEVQTALDSLVYKSKVKSYTHEEDDRTYYTYRGDGLYD